MIFLIVCINVRNGVNLIELIIKEGFISNPLKSLEWAIERLVLYISFYSYVKFLIRNYKSF